LKAVSICLLAIFLSLSFVPLFAVTITSEPNLVAFAQRPMDHPFIYQVEISGASNPLYSLTTAPQGMTIDANGKIEWVPEHEQAYYNDVSIKVTDGGDEVSQDIRIFVHGLNQATVDNLKTLNAAFNAAHAIERINHHLIFMIGDSQSNARLWVNTIFQGSMTEPRHNPMMWGYYHPDDNHYCDDLLNGGNEGQSWLRHGGHGGNFGNESGQTASWGNNNVDNGYNNNCGGGSMATVQYGHNDASFGTSEDDYASNMESIVQKLLAKNVIPILFTTPNATGGSWGGSANSKYPGYSDRVVALGKQYNVPVVDLRGMTISAQNLGQVGSLQDLLGDAVHYKYNSGPDPQGGNVLHNPGGALNHAMHGLVHTMGFLFDLGAKTLPPPPADGWLDAGIAANGWPIDTFRVGTVDNEQNQKTYAVKLNNISAAPNPFNPSTTIKFPNFNQNANILIYDIMGKEAASFKKIRENFINFNAGMFQSGIYTVRISSGKNNYIKNITLIK
jgi:hypothetical protein